MHRIVGQHLRQIGQVNAGFVGRLHPAQCGRWRGGQKVAHTLGWCFVGATAHFKGAAFQLALQHNACQRMHLAACLVLRGFVGQQGAVGVAKSGNPGGAVVLRKVAGVNAHHHACVGVALGA